MSQDIPCLDTNPRLITFAPIMDTCYTGNFNTAPNIKGTGALIMATTEKVDIVETSWMEVDLERAAAFCSHGTVFSVHPKRTLALLAYWRMLRGCSEAAQWMRIFSNTTDLCEAFYKPISYVTFEERSNFSITLVAKALGLNWFPVQFPDNTIMSEATKILLTLCQRIHSGS